MKITDVIRSVLDLVDRAEAQDSAPAEIAIAVEPDAAEPAMVNMPDELTIIQQLAGMTAIEPEYANEPAEVVASIGAAFPGGDDMHSRKNPADIRTNAPSMYPGFQAETR